MTKKKKPLSTRAKARLAKMRRDPFGRLCLEVGRYLETVGWRALIIGEARVQGFPKGRLGHFEFVVKFTGGKIQSPAPSKPLSAVRSGADAGSAR